MELILEGHKDMGVAIGKVIKETNDRKKMIKEVMVPAAKIVKKVMKSKAPKLKGYPSFNVYRTAKMKPGMRAPKGMGKIYVKIKPGQLRKSISYFRTKASNRAGGINIGPRYKKGAFAKPEKGGWYMHMVQFGTDKVKAQPFVLQALLATRKGVGNLMKKLMAKRIAAGVKKTNGKITSK